MTDKRVTLLFKTPDSLAECVKQGDGALELSECRDSYVVQRRSTEALDGSNGFQGIRFTWRGSSESLSVVGPPLNDGANLYVPTGNEAIAKELEGKFPHVATPKYTLYHEPHGKDLLETLCNLLNISERHTFDFKNNQYDVVLEDGMLRVDEYTVVQPGDPVPAPITAPPAENKSSHNFEVGMFYIDSVQRENVNLSGMRCVWKDDGKDIERCIKTSLLYRSAFTPSRLRPSQISMDLETPVGLHPKIMIDLSNATDTGTQEQCAYYMFAQLPVQLFVDKFQSDPVFVFGEHNLESPDYKVSNETWGSETLFTLTPGEKNEITLHSRYVAPGESAGYSHVDFVPQVFMACDTEQPDIAENPFYTKGMGLEAFFTDDTAFYPLKRETLTVPIPYPGVSAYGYIEVLTLMSLVTATFYLLFKLFSRVSPKPHSSIAKKHN